MAIFSYVNYWGRAAGVDWWQESRAAVKVATKLKKYAGRIGEDWKNMMIELEWLNGEEDGANERVILSPRFQVSKMVLGTSACGD